MNNVKDPVPFLDLVTPHKELEEELTAVFRKALGTAGFIGGSMVEEFEHNFAQYCETKYCIGVGSGTDALRFALIASGIRPGEIVITVPNTFIATSEAISQAGGVPDFIDIDEHTFNMDPRQLAVYIETKCSFDSDREVLTHISSGRVVRALIPVHLYGQPAEMDPILELAKKYRLVVVEDACQAHGARYYSSKEQRWRKAGSMGLAGAFSFYPGKNLGACGEAGAVITNDDTLASKIRMLRDHGQARKYYHEMEGYNGRLDAIQAGILNVKLSRLDKWNCQRRQAAAYYSQLLAQQKHVTVPVEPSWAESVYHLYAITVKNRDSMREFLASCGVGTGIHYPIPLHFQNAYSKYGYGRGDFPIAERVATELLSLPMYPQLRSEQQLQVARLLSQFVSIPDNSHLTAVV